MHKIIDIYSPFATAVAHFLQSVGFLRGSNKWTLVAFLIAVCWLWLVSKRNSQQTNTFWTSDKCFLVCLLLGSFLLRLPILAYTHMDVDESEWIVGAATFYNDPRFWLSVDGTTSGPLVIIPLSIIPFFGGSLSYVSVRLFATCTYLLPSILLVYWALKRLNGRLIADVVILPLAFLVSTANSLVVYSGEFSIMFLTALSLYLYSLYSGQKTLKFLFFFGISIGLLAYTKPQAIPLGICIGLFSLWKINLSGWVWRKTWLFVLGALLPTLIVFGYVFVANLWYDFSNSYILNNLHYGNTTGAMGNDLSLTELIIKTKQYLNFIDEYTYWLYSAQIATVLGMVVGTKAIVSKTVKLHFDFVFFSALFLVAVFCTLKPKTFFYHYQNMLLIPATFIVATVLSYFQTALKNATIFENILTTFLTLNLILSGILAVIPSYGQLRLDTKRQNISTTMRAIEDYTKPNDKMAIWGWNTPLFVETGLLQGTRDGHTHYHMTPIALQNYYLNRYRSDLERNNPEIFVETFSGYSALVFGSDGRKQYGIENYPIIYDFLKSHYELKADIDGQTRIFVRKFR